MQFCMRVRTIVLFILVWIPVQLLGQQRTISNEAWRADLQYLIYLNQTPLLHRYPIRIQWFSDGLFVTEATATLKGALAHRIRAINGVSIDEVMNRVRSVIPQENRYWLEYQSQDYLVIPEVLHDLGLVNSFGAATLDLDDNQGNPLTIDISPLSTTSGVEWIAAPSDDVPPPLYRRDPTFNYWVQYLLATAPVNVAAKSNIPKFLDELMTVPANFLGRVVITGATPFSVIGLNFFGSIFLTQPATILP